MTENPVEILTRGIYIIRNNAVGNVITLTQKRVLMVNNIYNPPNDLRYHIGVLISIIGSKLGCERVGNENKWVCRKELFPSDYEELKQLIHKLLDGEDGRAKTLKTPAEASQSVTNMSGTQPGTQSTRMVKSYIRRTNDYRLYVPELMDTVKTPFAYKVKSVSRNGNEVTIVIEVIE